MESEKNDDDDDNIQEGCQRATTRMMMNSSNERKTNKQREDDKLRRSKTGCDRSVKTGKRDIELFWRGWLYKETMRCGWYCKSYN